MRHSDRVVVIGGGASGTLAAVHLLRRGGPGLAVAIVEPRPMLGHGVAFGTPDPWHRLNVPAITMTGLPDEPDHFRAFAGCTPAAFPARHVFGEYLGSLLAETRAASPAMVTHVRARALRVRDGRAGEGAPLVVEVVGTAATTLPADAVVIASGNELPRPPAFAEAVAAAGDPRFVRDPWAPGALGGISPGTTVGIIGTGHTAIDLAASLILGSGVARV
ncbi:MAG TPA: FAD/NAD(P)-binding protein, partial [Candidatus Limnocylindrales bacterium]|nr:FAD/NAD(P)-binding protein [Candidatus Limnocylindrales bacterium]